MTKALEELAGAALGILVLVDIFLLVLYARANTALISRYLPETAWRFFVWVSRPFGRWRSTFLALSGPAIVVMVFAAWSLLLSLATALIIHPNLGTAIRATQGSTPTDFFTALYVGGTSLSFIGASEFSPQTPLFRLFFLVTSLIGVSIVTLAVTYLMQLYTSLNNRNTLGLKVQLLTGQTGDAAELIARLCPRGSFENAYSILMDWAAETTQVKESHHFYPVLFYFRFREPYYSVSRTSLVALDTISLLRSTLDSDEYAWLLESAALDCLWRATQLELKTLTQNFLSQGESSPPPDDTSLSLWRRRYTAALERLQQAGIPTGGAGVDQYLALRAEWDGMISQLAPRLAYDLDEIDPAVARLRQTSI